ncbi:MAG TPA: ABC transporter permease, partial [Gemmatimonadaceae bacterium]|nr:ABC transporter permease [Gemmatimonadaceae bacterium]
PALRLSDTAPRDVLKEGSRGASDGRSASRARSWLIASQVGLSALLLVTAGLFLRSFVRVINAERGFTEEHVLAFNVSLPTSQYKTRDLRNAFYEEALRRVSALPGVTAAGLTNGLPLEGETWVESIWRQSDDAAPQHHDVDANFRLVSPSYFALLGVRTLSGRLFTDADRGTSRVVLSENTARSLWPGENAIGKLARLGGTDSVYEVIGIVANVRTTGLEREGSLTVYTPYWERGYSPTILLRTKGDPASLATPARAVFRALAPAVPVSRVRTINQIVSGLVAQRRFELVLIAVFAVTALLTASIGIYGIVTHSLGRRAKEISVRIALGALPNHVRVLVLGEVLRPVAVGLVGGMAASLMIGRAIAGLLFEVNPADAATLVSVALILPAVAALACWVPVRRATRLDAAEALRAG